MSVPPCQTESRYASPRTNIAVRRLRCSARGQRPVRAYRTKYREQPRLFDNLLVRARTAMMGEDVRVTRHVDDARPAVRPGFEPDIENNGDALAAQPSPVWLLLH